MQSSRSRGQRVASLVVRVTDAAGVPQPRVRVRGEWSHTPDAGGAPAFKIKRFSATTRGGGGPARGTAALPPSPFVAASRIVFTITSVSRAGGGGAPAVWNTAESAVVRDFMW